MPRGSSKRTTINKLSTWSMTPWKPHEVGNSKMELGDGEKRKAENQRVNSAPGNLPSAHPWEMTQAWLMPADSPFGP